MFFQFNFILQENALQSKLISLESDLTRIKSENIEIKRSKDDVSGF